MEVNNTIVPPAAPELPDFPETVEENKPQYRIVPQDTQSEPRNTAEDEPQYRIVSQKTQSEPRSAVENRPQDNIDPLETQLERVIYWRDPVFTGAVFGAVNILCILILSKKYTLLGVSSFCALAVTAGCFLYINGSKMLVGHLGKDAAPRLTFEIRPFSQKAIHAKVDQTVSALNGLMEKGRDIALCKDNFTTLKAMAVVFASYKLGQFIPDLVLFYIVFLAIFTVPVAYEMNKEQIDKAAADAQNRLKEEKNNLVKIANEKTNVIREQATKKISETTTPLYKKMQPQIDNLRQRVAKPATTAEAN
eukprot:Plantae.Rhodophyta-Purpureofilum_apyrenoidigerum.ctg687.p1 GENE.Plantae.Rhodophyta-Purpureofilum_apyrenoidigerum.ctg687~~Plantae.Rhodophyta-Purpureofilum_apyrenoidigerum.ctg687.p1  ORF type:complete len:306 (+),score=73.35 Plantae.Rhodophyta-Purpureofilum_apyrenoidigerum.ctg687:277-1194(+)